MTFPLSANPFQPNGGGSTDAFVAKFDAAASSLEYASYLGGSGENTATGVALDDLGRAYVRAIPRPSLPGRVSEPAVHQRPVRRERAALAGTPTRAATRTASW